MSYLRGYQEDLIIMFSIYKVQHPTGLVETVLVESTVLVEEKPWRLINEATENDLFSGNNRFSGV